MIQDDVHGVLEVGDIFQDVRPFLGVLVDDFPLLLREGAGFAQYFTIDANLADIVEQGPELDGLQLGGGE
jgi:hypothetical protein